MTHKKNLAMRVIAIPMISLALMTSCDKDDNDMVDDKTIAETVAASDNFSTLEAAVVKANLQATLSGPGPFTVFAPDNESFTASGISDATLNSLTTQQVTGILLYHTLNSKVEASSVPAGPNAAVTTASGDSVFVTRNASGVFVNGIAVEEADISASNGVIHRIGRVLLPPSGDLVAIAQAPGSGLDSLVKAVVTAVSSPGGDPSLLTNLQSATLTVFAPNNAAFTELLGALGISNIDQIPIATLLAVLKYHVVPGRAFSSDLANGNLAMLAGGNTTINLNNDGGPTITGSGNAGVEANIIKTNIMARNGVVHVIDQVLLP